VIYSDATGQDRPKYKVLIRLIYEVSTAMCKYDNLGSVTVRLFTN